METAPVEAVWLDSKRSRGIPARLWVNPALKSVRAANSDGRSVSAPISRIKISSRVGHTRRTMRFPDGTSLIIADNNILDEALEAAGMRRSVVHRLESASPVTLLATVCVSILLLAALVVKGLPVVSEKIAWSLPAGLLDDVGKRDFERISESFLEASRLGAGRQEEVREMFDRVAVDLPAERPIGLEIRRMSYGDVDIPNAFALPQGIVLLSDRLIELAESDDELIGVIAHEIEHIRQRHILRRFVESSLLTVLLEMAVGNFTMVPETLAFLRYSREHEREADCLAYRYLLRRGLDPEGIGRILARMEGSLFETGEADETGAEDYPEALDLLSTHPSTDVRSDPESFCKDFLSGV